MKGTTDRGVVDLVDVFLTFILLVALMVLAPYFYHFTDMGAAEADPLSSLLLRLIVPFLFIGMIVSVGVSAKGGS